LHPSAQVHEQHAEVTIDAAHAVLFDPASGMAIG
jgi:hypothetical protein